MNKRLLPCVLAGFVLGEVWIWQFSGTTALAALCFTVIILFIIGVKRKGSFFLFGRKSRISCQIKPSGGRALTREEDAALRPRSVQEFCGRNSLILISIGILLGGCRQYEWQGQKDHLSVWKNGEEHLIEGQIEEMNQKEFSYSIVIDSILVDGQEQGGRLLIYLKKEPLCQIGSKVVLKGSIEDFDLPSNPGGFHQRMYREARGILGVIKDADILKINLGSFLIKDGIYEIREKASKYMNSHMNEEMTGIGIAMAFGDKNYLSEELKDLYEFGGISHVLAVSGLHMSLLGAVVYKMLRRFGWSYSISVFASFPWIAVYAVMTGLSSSCFRAAIMLFVYLIAEWKGYYYDLPSSLSLAGILLLYEIPARLFDSGFLLSFGAMISVGVICPFLFKIFHYKTGRIKIRDAFVSGIIIMVFTLPFSLYFFYGFSIAGLLLNLIVIPLMSFLVPLLFVGGMGWFVLIPNLISDFCFQLAEWILRFYCSMCELAKSFSFFYMQVGYRGIFFAVGYYVIIVIGIGFSYILYKRKRKLCFLVSSFFVIGLIMFIHITGRTGAFLTVLDVGQGDGILYHSEAGEVCMIDGGSTSEKNIGRYVIRPALEYYGIARVDYWFLSHMDEDHISGLMELLEQGYPVTNLILPIRKDKCEKQEEIESLAQENGTIVHYMKQGDELRLTKETIYCLYPKKNVTGEDENQNSLVLLLETKQQQILLTGDIEYEGEKNMALYLKKLKLNKGKEKILKVAHHGSSNGTQDLFLECFEPNTALVSCGIDNSYGHPAKETVDRLQKKKTTIFYTMDQGAIEVRLGKEASYFGYGMVQ